MDENGEANVASRSNSMRTTGQSGGSKILEGHAVNFAGGVERHFSEHDNFAGGFVADAAAGELDEFSSGGTSGVGLQDDVGPHIFAMHEVVDSDDAGGRDGRVLEE